MTNSLISKIARLHIIVAVAAALLTAETYLHIGQPISYLVLLTVFLATLGAYSVANLELHIASKESTARVSVFGEKIDLALASISLFLLTALTLWLDIRTTMLLLLVGACSLLYMNPVRFHNQRLAGMRNVCFLKNALLAIVWALTTVSIPLLSADLDPFNTAHLYILLRRVAFVFSLAVIFDLRDVERDRRINLRTVATQFGATATKVLAYSALIFFILLNYFDPTIHPALPLSLSAALAMLTIWGANISRSDLYYTVIVDGVMIAQFVFVVLLS